MCWLDNKARLCTWAIHVPIPQLEKTNTKIIYLLNKTLVKGRRVHY